MKGISLKSLPAYVLSSPRTFAEHEHHITRKCPDDVLLMMYDGVLRFEENGVPVELRAGEYYIQQRMLQQTAPLQSDRPSYFYIHFIGKWTDDEPCLPRRGIFYPEVLRPILKQLEIAVRLSEPPVICSGLFYTALSELYRIRTASGHMNVMNDIARRLTADLLNPPTLTELSAEYNFSVNYLLRLFRDSMGQTPHAYLQSARIRQACILLLTSNATADTVAQECGFSDYSHFYKSFIRATGCSPSEFRAGKGR